MFVDAAIQLRLQFTGEQVIGGSRDPTTVQQLSVQSPGEGQISQRVEGPVLLLLQAANQGQRIKTQND